MLDQVLQVLLAEDQVFLQTSIFVEEVLVYTVDLCTIPTHLR